MIRSDSVSLAAENRALRARIAELEAALERSAGNATRLATNGNAYAPAFAPEILDLPSARQRIEQVENQIHRSEDRLQAILDNNPDVIALYDPALGYQYVSPSVRQMLGYQPEELMQMSYQELIHPEDIAAVDALMKDLVSEAGAVRKAVYRTRHKDGSWRWVENRVCNYLDHPAIQALVSITQDISERVTVERALLALKETLEQRVEDRTRALQGQIAERKRIEEALTQRSTELTKANVELAKGSRLKDEFLASMSHELRTPLTGILGLTEGLQNNVYGPLNDSQLRAMQLIDESGRHLLNLINDILDLSKVEAGKMDLEVESMLASDVCQSSLRMIRHLAQKKRQRVSYTVEPVNLVVQADARRLKQVLVNLLSNAVKFTPEDGDLGLVVQLDGAERLVRFTVWDKGIGIAAEQQSGLFQPFMQLDSGLARQFGGTGLGLALVRRLTELHGGHVEVTSHVGHGSKFVVVLPWVPMPLPGADGVGIEVAPGILSAETRPRAGRILIVEDNMTTATALADYMTAHGFQTLVAYNGADAILMTEEYAPDVILMDIQMPGVDGLEATRRIRTSSITGITNTPIVAVTALAMTGDRERCLAAGATDYLSKPVELNIVCQTTIQRYLPNTRMPR